MFGKFLANTCLMMFVLLAVGCGASLNGEGGVEPTDTLFLDDDFEFSATIEKGEVLAIDMREPIQSGFTIIGASFDPEVLSLVNYLKYKDDGKLRAQYMFQALVDGTTDVLVKMEPVGGGDVNMYKRVTINVGESDSLF